MILFEDNHVLVVDKPAGLLTQPTDENRESLETTLKALIKKRDNKPGEVYLHAIFRLDRPVGGIVLFAKSSKALSRLNASQKERNLKKTYQALLEGIPPAPKGDWVDFVVHDDFRARIADKNDQGAKLAQLSYRLIEKKGTFGLIEVDLLTGRYHQIRIQCASRGLPIVGDAKYGSHSPFKEGAIALHHTQFSFPHPISGEVILFKSEFNLNQ